MKLYLIRHGHRADSEPDYKGGYNPALSARGHRQAGHLAEYMADKGLTALYSSCMLRALETALPIQKKVGLPLQVWPTFCETSTLSWTEVHAKAPYLAELTVAWRTDEPADRLDRARADAPTGNYYHLSELPERYPAVELTQPFHWPDAWWTALYGGCRETAYARIELGTQALLARHQPDDNVALVGHGNSGDMMLALLLDMSRKSKRRFRTANTCICELEIDAGGHCRLLRHNAIDHLPETLRN